MLEQEVFKYNKVNIGHYLKVNGYNRLSHNIKLKMK